MRRLLPLAALLLLVPGATGLVMNGNTDDLPPGCDAVSGHENITVRAGTEQAREFPGTVFTYSDHSFRFDPCTKVTVTLVNTDSVRHQFMVHDLPRSVYPNGMFTVETTGPGNETGTFILPSTDETLLVHCAVPQHEQKGMKAQIVVGEGHGNLPNIPGVTGGFDDYAYETGSALIPGGIAAATGFLLGLAAMLLIGRRVL